MEGRVLYLNNNYNGLNGNNNLNNNGRFVGIVKLNWLRQSIIKKNGHPNCTARVPPPEKTSGKECILTYENLCSTDNLELAFKKARKGKTKKDYVLEFEKDLDKNLLSLRIELLMQTYNPQPLKSFIIRDPKTRKISKSAFKDRIVHHAICNTIEPIFDKAFIHDSYANRKGKGTFKALERFDQFKKIVSKNNTEECYVLKADVKHYFDNVDHKILIRLLEKKIRDVIIIRLIRKILANHQGSQPGKGMPLGNLTSQFFANVYLNELDRYVKHSLRAKHYTRYVDDFVILHSSKQELEHYKIAINEYLQDKLKIALHPDKSQIIPLSQGITFLGFRIFYHHRLIRKKNLKKFERKIEGRQRVYFNRKINREQIVEKFEGWLAYTNHADTYKYRRRITSQFNNKFPIKPNVKTEISQTKKHENLNQKIADSKVEYTIQKTHCLLRKGLNIKQIARQRGLKESTVWNHFEKLIKYHKLKLNEVLSQDKIKKIISSIKSQTDKMTDIKQRLKDESITFNEIGCVLAGLRAKNKKQSIAYFLEWYKKVNCRRKCYYNKSQREECRRKFQLLAAQCHDLAFKKNDFLDFLHKQTTICALPEKERNRFMSWKEFRKSRLKAKKGKKHSVQPAHNVAKITTRFIKNQGRSSPQ